MNNIAEFVYKVAKSNGRLKAIMSLLGTVFWYGAVALMVFLSPWLDDLMGLKLSIPAVVANAIASLLLVIGMPMVLWTIFRFFLAKGTPVPFNPPPILVTDGLYAHVRNPMHLGWLIVLIGLSFLRQSFSLLVIFTPAFLLVHVLYLKLVEEKELEKITKRMCRCSFRGLENN
jgi:protein-S-isoprenylcysteine O-methyltransferase Ste14